MPLPQPRRSWSAPGALAGPAPYARLGKRDRNGQRPVLENGTTPIDGETFSFHSALSFARDAAFLELIKIIKPGFKFM
jgi:hypothetical protein